MREELEVRLETLERRNRWLAAVVLLQLPLVLMLRCATTPVAAPPASLRLHDLVIVDDRGVERVRVGGNLPDPVIHGKRVSRGDEAAGVLLYDRTGQERGGYITFRKGNQVALTLDSADAQSALFVAPAEGGSALRLGNGGDEVTLRSDEDGARLTAVENGKVVYQQPPIAAPGKTSICTELRAARGKNDDATLLMYCRKAMTDEACRECLALK
jgi:hypothetical protein